MLKSSKSKTVPAEHKKKSRGKNKKKPTSSFSMQFGQNPGGGMRYGRQPDAKNAQKFAHFWKKVHNMCKSLKE